MELVSRNRCWRRTGRYKTHSTRMCVVEMTFAVYLRLQARTETGSGFVGTCSGLTCTHDNAMTKGGFQKYAADTGVVAWCFQTHRPGVTGGGADDEAYDLGYLVAGFLSECHATTMQRIRCTIWGKNFRGLASGTKLPDHRSPRHHRPFDGRGMGTDDCNAQPFSFCCLCLLLPRS